LAPVLVQAAPVQGTQGRRGLVRRRGAGRQPRAVLRTYADTTAGTGRTRPGTGDSPIMTNRLSYRWTY